MSSRTGGGRRKALARTQSDEDFVVSGSDDSYTSSRRSKRNRKEKSGRRAQWHSDSESEENDETNDEDEDGIDLNAVDGSADGPKTRTGRPLRKAVAKSKATLLDVSDDGVDGNEDYENGLSDPDKLAKKGRFVVDSDSDVFEPDEEMDDDDDDDEEGGASSDAAGSAANEENNMEKNVIEI
ncbi:hypothetical protein KIN20_004219 [Parelaphostrongylus tenuis]|uniref:Uncharacterized protein n=1 Tax=Parelaphostrongylus tenuis TaxID=148309 RepID=A0AAD5QEA2_PARTN|nr:hypothetical protein KIN20_004219 [Parelaphostrongylus tenuis]